MIQQLVQMSRKQPLKKYHSSQEWAGEYHQKFGEYSWFDRSVFGGFTSQQFSFAFLSGYQAALHKMFPILPDGGISALCVSEAKGGHPKNIQTTLIDGKVNGLKTYVTAGSEVKHLLVLCKTETIVEGKSVLKMVRLDSANDKITITDFGLPFMKEIKHGKMHLKDIEIGSAQILEGDGYVDYTKPFRTYEDIFVGAAYQAMLLRQAIECNWEAELREQILLQIHTLKYLLTLPPMGKETHLLLAANEENFQKLLPTIETQIMQHSSPEFREDWRTNKRVLSIAKEVKAFRLGKAREVLFG